MKEYTVRVYTREGIIPVKITEEERTSYQVGTEWGMGSAKVPVGSEQRDVVLHFLRSMNLFKFFLKMDKNLYFIYLGEIFPVIFLEGRKSIEWLEDKVIVHAPDKEKGRSYYEKWKKKTYLDLFTKVTEEHYDMLKNRLKLTKMPKITMADVKSYWGKCFYTRNEIRYSEELAKYPYDHLEYVVCHELAHFVYPNHQENFYTLLQDICPKTEFFRKNRIYLLWWEE